MDSSRDVSNSITLRDVFEKIIRVAEDVAVMREDIHHIRLQTVDHEKRIRAIERRLWALPSLATLIAVVGLVVAVLDRIRGG